MLLRYGWLLFTAAVVVVVAAGGWQLWKRHEAQQTAKVAQAFLIALDGASGPPGDARKAAALELAGVAHEGDSGYRALALLREAALEADAGDGNRAQALWSQVADDTSADPMVRDVAVLQSVLHQIDTGDPATLQARLKPLAAPDNPWHALAEEAQALIDLRQGRNDAARDTLKRLVQDATAPDGVRGRANGLLARLGG
jgi:hypothetical protein